MTFEKLARRLAALPDEMAAAKAKLAELIARRPDAIAASLIAEDWHDADNELRAAIAVEELKIERFSLCQPAMEQRVKAARSKMEAASSPSFGISDELEQRRAELRLELAIKRSN